MNAHEAKSPLEAILAEMLKYGTWLASAIIAAGLTLSLVEQLAGAHPAVPLGIQIVTAGIALFIILPVLRVIVMLTVFLWQRDFRFGAAAALVLIIMIAGFTLGALPSKAHIADMIDKIEPHDLKLSIRREQRETRDLQLRPRDGRER